MADAVVARWHGDNYQARSSLLDTILARPPLIVLEGDVGFGKSALAESIGIPWHVNGRSTSPCSR